MGEDLGRYWLALSRVPGIGAAYFNRLLEHYECPRTIWEASNEELLHTPGIDKTACENLLLFRDKTDIDKGWAAFLESDIKIATKGDNCYPQLLKTIYNPPPVLYYRGSIDGLNNPAIAIVGSRRCSAYGKHVAEQFAKELAGAGFTVISGLARGIDASAHRGALQAGRTWAVLGCGVDIVYPPENKNLLQQIVQDGAVLSEYPPGTPPHAVHFPARNRLISGLATGVIVVEAAEKSGALITVDFALEQGRDVYAVPGCITNPFSQGCHKLIQQGAKLVASIEDILEDYGLTLEKKHTNDNKVTEMSLEEQTLMGYLGVSPIGIDQIVQKSGWEVSRIACIMLGLEIKGLIENMPGKRFKIADVKGLRR
jgi:DNA processing protein